MAVFEYRASVRKREDFFEYGTVIARDEQEARQKLQRLDFDKIKLKRLEGLSGFFKHFVADVR